MRAFAIGTMLAFLAGGAALAQPPQMMPRPADGDLTPVDYGRDDAWICRPGVDRGRPGEAGGTCSANLDAVTIDQKGVRTPAPFVAAKDAKVDCFYVYPTVSADKTLYADMAVGPEELRAVHGQAARLGSVCRLFAPIYHQLTGAGLAYALSFMMRGQPAPEMKMDVPYRDVLAAWRDYLKRDNHGRGVILVGHSQGAMILKRLLAEEIDGKPAQKLLVGAYLAGNPDLTDKSFKAIRPCAAKNQTGCIVAWSSYREGFEGSRLFGAGAPGAKALCVNPAAPGGGRAGLATYLSKPREAPAGDPPYVETIGALTAECVRDDKGAVLAVKVEPGPAADRMENALAAMSRLAPVWGLHTLDISLVQGDMIAMMQAQIGAWKR